MLYCWGVILELCLYLWEDYVGPITRLYKSYLSHSDPNLAMHATLDIECEPSVTGDVIAANRGGVVSPLGMWVHSNHTNHISCYRRHSISRVADIALTGNRGGLEAQKAQLETHTHLHLSFFSIMNAYITMLPTTVKINLPCIPRLHSDREQGRVRSSV